VWFNSQRVKLDLPMTRKQNPSNQRKKTRQTRKTICSPVESPILLLDKLVNADIN
jgi:hypothetical protein